MSLGKQIKLYREKKGLTQEELGELIGVKGATITRYEKDQRQPKIEQLQQISLALNVPIFTLIGDTKTEMNLRNGLSHDLFQLELLYKSNKDMHDIHGCFTTLTAGILYTLNSSDKTFIKDYSFAVCNLLDTLTLLLSYNGDKSECSQHYLNILTDIDKYLEYQKHQIKRGLNTTFSKEGE